MNKQNIEIPEVIRKMDIILHLFAVNSLAKDGLYYKDAHDMANLLFQNESPKINPIDNNEFYRITEKLKKDGYVANEVSTIYEATYEGVLMEHLGGYRQKYLEVQNLQQLQIHRDLMAKRLYWINFWIAIATGVAALYYFDQLCSKYHWFSCH
jgi:hypothetical protein